MARIEPVPSELGRGVPEGTTASRCTGCGEVRLRAPGDLMDEWRKHFDYCSAEDAEDGDVEAMSFDQPLVMTIRELWTGMILDERPLPSRHFPAEGVLVDIPGPGRYIVEFRPGEATTTPQITS